MLYSEKSVVEIEPFPLSRCSVLRAKKRINSTSSLIRSNSEISSICTNLRFKDGEDLEICSCLNYVETVNREHLEEPNSNLKHHYDCPLFKRVSYANWDRSKRHILVSIPKSSSGSRRVPTSAREQPHLSLEELLMQQTAANHKMAMQDFARMQATIAQREADQQDRKILRYSRELEKRAMNLCNLEDILVERTTHVIKKANTFNLGPNNLGVREDARRSSIIKEGRQRKLSQAGIGMTTHRGSNVSTSDNSSLRVDLSRLGAARHSVGGGATAGGTSSMGTHRSESKPGVGSTSRQVVVEKRIRVPTPLTREPVVFNVDFN